VNSRTKEENALSFLERAYKLFPQLCNFGFDRVHKVLLHGDLAVQIGIFRERMLA
jgi:hypothetical protein